MTRSQSFIGDAALILATIFEFQDSISKLKEEVMGLKAYDAHLTTLKKRVMEACEDQ